MKSDTHDQENIRRYLLGQLPPQNLSALEERFFFDSELYEELSIVEDELIDEYLRGELAPSEREQFESHFMAAPERHEKMGFARALKKFVSIESAAQPHEFPSQLADDGSVKNETRRERGAFFSFLPFQNPIVSYALAAAVILVLVGVSWIAWKNWSPAVPGKVLAIELAPGSMTRDLGVAETKIFTIPADTDTVRLQLDLPQVEYPTYEAVVQNVNLGQVLTKKNLKAQSSNGRPTVLVEVPPSSLPRGDYRIKLDGVLATGNVESVSTYFFRVLNN